MITCGGIFVRIPNPFRYASYQYDSETGSYYLKSRYYVPTLGRFLTKDPVQSYNRYTYCWNNPIRYVDPTGELVWPGEIHNAVSNHILWTQLVGSGRMLQSNKYVVFETAKLGFLNIPKKWGFADLYDNNTGEVWEIKRDKPQYYTSGPIQLQRYINHIKGASEGKSLGKGSFYYFSPGKLSPLPSIYKVIYRSYNNGMIYYNYDPVVDADAVALALALMATSILSGTYNGSTIPIPELG